MSVLILPIGSYEQHGPVLPPDTDIKIAEYMARELGKRIENASVLPVIPFGMAAEHDGFENTISISMQGAMVYWSDVLKSISNNMSQLDLVVLVNGHGGNQTLLETICGQMNYTTSGPRFAVFHVFQPSARKVAEEVFGVFSAHADSVETSVYAVLVSGFKRKTLQSFKTEVVGRHCLKLYPTRKISEDGIVSKLSTVCIDEEAGKRIIESSLQDMVNRISAYLEIIRL